ncbi:MAG: hypothetical protein ACF8PN_05305 [Phycisphaerales bacterium]
MRLHTNDTLVWSFAAGALLVGMAGVLFGLGWAFESTACLLAGAGTGVVGAGVLIGSAIVHGAATPPVAYAEDEPSREIDRSIWIFAPASVRALVAELELNSVEQAILRERAGSFRMADFEGWWKPALTGGVVMVFVVALLGPEWGAFAGPLGVVAVFLVVHFGPGERGRATLYERQVWRAINELGYAEICWRCGYRLDTIGGESLHCPECGQLRQASKDCRDRERGEGGGGASSS